MAAIPFQSFPKLEVAGKLLLPGIVPFGVGFLLTGFLAVQPGLQFKPKAGADLVEQRVVVTGGPVQAAVLLYAQVSDQLSRMPDACWSGNVASEFQKTQCDDFWGRLTLAGGLVALPFALLALFVLIGVDQTRSHYARARKRFKKAQPLGQGVVTDPPEAPNDICTFFLCLKGISIQLPNGQQIVVYSPRDEATPIPGQKMLAFEWGKILGSPRRFGVLYTPHLAVVSGSREA